MQRRWMAIGAAALAVLPAVSVMSQAPASHFPSSVLASSPPPAAAGLTNVFATPQINSPQVPEPTLTIPQATPFQIPQAFVPAMVTPGQPESPGMLPHTTAAMPRVLPPQMTAPTIRDMTLGPMGRLRTPTAPPAAAPVSVTTTSLNEQASGVVTNPDGSLVVPLSYRPTNAPLPGVGNAWTNRPAEIDGIKYHW